MPRIFFCAVLCCTSCACCALWCRFRCPLGKRESVRFPLPAPAVPQVAEATAAAMAGEQASGVM